MELQFGRELNLRVTKARRVLSWAEPVFGENPEISIYA
jgi:hypothetical protein